MLNRSEGEIFASKQNGLNIPFRMDFTGDSFYLENSDSVWKPQMNSDETLKFQSDASGCIGIYPWLLLCFLV